MKEMSGTLVATTGPHLPAAFGADNALTICDLLGYDEVSILIGEERHE
jgi:hypothetical protein